jgi:DNA-binding response OmpR family regulator
MIEDQRFISQIFCIVLKSAGHDVSTATDGRSGLAAFTAESPDLVITDINLPDISGFEVMQVIQQQAKVPVIVLTGGSANDAGDYLELALKYGAAAAFRKPVSADQMLAAVEKALGKA